MTLQLMAKRISLQAPQLNGQAPTTAKIFSDA
jgi:hypothetical protein